MKIYENTIDLFLDGEVWKDIDEYYDYQISNYGRIKSFKFKKIKILKQINDKDDYLFVRLSKSGKYKTKYIHILLFETFNNYKLKENEIIHHIDENKENNILNNFRLMTRSDINRTRCYSN